MKRAMLILALAGLAAAQDEKYYEAKKKALDDLAAVAAKIGDEYMKLKDYELASVAYALADRNGDDWRWRKAIEKLREAKQLTRANPGSIAALAKSYEQKYQLLQKASAALGLKDEAVRCEIMAAEMRHLTAFVEALRYINDIRRISKLPFCGFSQLNTESCMWHCRYMALERDFGHDEKASSPYYDKEGERAGRASCIATHGTPKEAVELHLSTLYHRIPFLDPGVRSVGFGYWPFENNQYSAVDCKRDVEKVDYVLAYPAPGQKNVPTQFCMGTGRETPNPLPEGVERAGYPVTLSFFGDTFRKIKKEANVRAVMRDGSGKEVPCYVSYPAKPANARASNNGLSVCLIPKEPLKHQMLYRATVELRYDGEQKKFETFFTTGNR